MTVKSGNNALSVNYYGLNSREKPFCHTLTVDMHQSFMIVFLLVKQIPVKYSYFELLIDCVPKKSYRYKIDKILLKMIFKKKSIIGYV